MNDHNNHITDDLLVKYLLGEATAEEQLRVELWIDADAANRKYYEQLQLIWNESKGLAAAKDVDENIAWQRFRQRIHEPEKEPARVRSFNWLRIAAMLILVAGAAWIAYFLFYDEPVKNIALQSQQAPLTDTLSDGSIITLNKNTVLSYPERFKQTDRSVTLKGEAFFRVTPDLKKPFIIQSADVTIAVIGTSFNVRSEKDSVEVIVETGAVQVTHGNQTIRLYAGDKAVVHLKDSTIVQGKEEEQLYNYYRSKEFVCDNTPLWKLVQTLNEAYDAQIEIARPELKNTPITTTFHNESLDRILEIVRLTLNISVTKTGDKIILR